MWDVVVVFLTYRFEGEGCCPCIVQVSLGLPSLPVPAYFLVRVLRMRVPRSVRPVLGGIKGLLTFRSYALPRANSSRKGLFMLQVSSSHKGLFLVAMKACIRL